VDSSFVHYQVTTSGGDSGSPVYLTDGEDPIAVAIHGYGSTPDNFGVRITAGLKANLEEWRDFRP
jgi:V8-like Glu-specific endopeptidase